MFLPYFAATWPTLTCPKLSFAAFDLLRGEIFWSLSAKFRRSSPAPFLKRNCMWPHFLLLCALGVAWRRKIELFIFASCNSLEHRIDSAWFSPSTSSTVQHATHYDTKGLVRGCWHCLVQLQHYDFSFLPPVTHCTFRSRPASRRTSCLKATKNQDHSLISRPQNPHILMHRWQHIPIPCTFWALLAPMQEGVILSFVLAQKVQLSDRWVSCPKFPPPSLWPWQWVVPLAWCEGSKKRHAFANEPLPRISSWNQAADC